MILDVFIAVPILWGMFRGFRRGLIIELCTLMALVLGVYGAAAFGDVAGGYLQSEFNTDPRVSKVLAFAIVFVLIIVLVFIFGKVLERLIKLVALGLLNKLAGMLFGGAKFALIVSGVFFILNGFPLTEGLIDRNTKKESYLYTPVSEIAPQIFPVLKEGKWFDAVEEKMNDFRDKIESK